MHLTLWFVMSLLLVGIAAAYWSARGHFQMLRLEGMKLCSYGRLPFITTSSLYMIQRWNITKRFPGTFVKLHLQLVTLHGPRHSHTVMQLLLADLVSYELMNGVVGAGWLSYQFDLANAVVIMLVAVVMPIYLLHTVNAQAAERRRQLILELPRLLSRLVLLVGAGESIVNGLRRCLASSRKQHPLYVELERMLNEVDRHVPFPQAMEQFAVRCSSQEVTLFATSVVMNYRKGGDEFLLALHSLNQQLWDKRKLTARLMGEEASTKLIFPMVLIFLVVMAVISAPALLIM